jgi:hypothetical protein
VSNIIYVYIPEIIALFYVVRHFSHSLDIIFLINRNITVLVASALLI